MAAEDPDPKTFTSWEEAFQHPIPTVRGMEKQLRRDIDANKEKLRTLVGASYRRLLNTAESIIDMNDQMHNVESHMAEIGQKCNTRLLEKKATNFHTWQNEINRPGSAKYTLASQLSVLRSCPDVIVRLLKNGESLLLAAKVLVVSRLLYTKLSKSPVPPPYLETVRIRLATLRRKLLARIDRRFKILDITRDALLESMCAFVLATSSSSTDVVRHFHHLRLEAITQSMTDNSGRQDSMLRALRFYLKTLKDSQALAPGQLAHALEKLKIVSIFKSDDLHNMIELNLDVYERWIENDIKTFTPYIRHDDLCRAEAERLLKQWAKTAVQVFLDGLRDRIKDVWDPVKLMQSRKDVIELWLNQHQHALGIDSAETLTGLREVFNHQAIMIIRQRVSALKAVAVTVQRNIKDWQQGQSDVNPSLWDPLLTSMDITNGGKQFCDTITDRLKGKNEPLSRVSAEYTTWLGSISAIEQTIKSIRETRWEDSIDEVDGDDDDGFSDDKQILLAREDPSLLQGELSTALATAYEALEKSLEPTRLFTDLSTVGPKGIFLLRVWRELRQRLPSYYRNIRLGSSSVSEIEIGVIGFVLIGPLKSCSKRLNKVGKHGSLASRSLWEGNPELPVLPSPWAYRLLLEVVQSMSELGADIWSPHLSAKVKKKLAQDVASLLRKGIKRVNKSDGMQITKANGHAKEHTNGENIATNGEGQGAGEAAKETSRGLRDEELAAGKDVNGTHLNGNGGPEDNASARDLKMQRLFDVSYLVEALSTETLKGNIDGELKQIQESLEKVLELETKSLQRLTKNASEYWKRTKLLFALL